MSRDNAPIGNTCPTIDNIIAKLESAKGEAEWIKKNPDEDITSEIVTIIDETYDSIVDMENIRNDNTELRSWGNEQYDLVQDLESERDDALRDNDYLKEEIEELKSKVEELESELSEVN